MAKRGLEVILLSLLAMTSLPGVPDPAAAAPSSGLIGYWSFDGNGNDLSGGGRDLSLFGGVGFASGLFGQALDLHGNGAQYAQRPVDDAIYDFGSSDFTFQAWVNFNTTSGEQVIIEKFQGGGGPGWTGTKLVGNQWHFWATPSAVLYSPVQSIPANVWHHVLVRRSGNLFDFFYDGLAVASGSDPDPVPDTSFPLLIGRRNYLDGRVFPVDGRIDEVAIWNRPLTNEEVSLLWNQGAGTSPIPEPDTLLLLGSGLVGLAAWRRGKES
jgi:hypothetical protein